MPQASLVFKMYRAVLHRNGCFTLLSYSGHASFEGCHNSLRGGLQARDARLARGRSGGGRMYKAVAGVDDVLHALITTTLGLATTDSVHKGEEALNSQFHVSILFSSPTYLVGQSSLQDLILLLFHYTPTCTHQHPAHLPYRRSPLSTQTLPLRPATLHSHRHRDGRLLPSKANGFPVQTAKRSCIS